MYKRQRQHRVVHASCCRDTGEEWDILEFSNLTELKKDEYKRQECIEKIEAILKELEKTAL